MATTRLQQQHHQQPASSEAGTARDAAGATVHSGSDEDQPALLPTPRSSGSSSLLHFGPRLEEPNHSLLENGHNHHHHYSGINSDRDRSEAVVTPKPRESASPSLPTVASAPSPSSSSINNEDSHNDNDNNNTNNGSSAINNNNNLPPATLRLTIPDHETTESNHYFLSEPSLSPDDDSSRIRAPHRLPAAGGRAFRHRSSSGDEEGGQLPRFAQASPVPSSPGNTSLSSWDSPSRSKNRVLLQFTPSAFQRGGSGMSSSAAASQPPVQPQHSSSPSFDNNNANGLLHISSHQHNSSGSATPNGAMLRVRSPDRSSLIRTPPAIRHSDRVMHENALSGGPDNKDESNKSAAAVEEPDLPLPSLNEKHRSLESAGAETLPAKGDTPNSMTSFRRLMDGLKDAGSVSDSLAFDASVAAAGLPATASSTGTKNSRMTNGHHHHQQPATEESIIMDLSDSEDEIVINNNVRRPIDSDRKHFNSSSNNSTDHSQINGQHLASRTSTFDSEYMQDQTADDEKTTATNEQVDHNYASFTAEKKPQHSRQTPIIRARSGDAVAATLATGGRDWAGMKMDNIPLPDEEEEDEDDHNHIGAAVEMKQQKEPALFSPVPDGPKTTSPVEEIATTPTTQQDLSQSGSSSNNNNRSLPPQPQQMAQAQRPGTARPPKPEPRVSPPQPILPPPPPPPQHMIPPPPTGMPPTDPNYAPPFQYHVPAGYNKHFPPSPSVSVSSHHSSHDSPQISPQNMWTQQQHQHSHQQWVPQHDGFVVQSQRHAAPDVHSPWTEPQRLRQPYGSSAALRERLNSWAPSPDIHEQGRDRRHSWGSGRYQSSSVHSSVRSPHESLSDHGSMRGSNHSNRHQKPNSPHEPDEGSDNSISSSSSDDDDDESHDDFDENRPMRVRENQLLRGTELSMDRIDDLEHQLENRNFRGAYQNMMRARSETALGAKPLGSPFANIGKKREGPVDRASFFPKTSLADEDGKRYPTFLCPRCNTRQREFFSVSTAPKQLEGPTGYLAAYFVLYVTASLFIFGLEEGWEPLDCIYFAVISLTTAGLGDYVPTTDSNKIICSVFIYFGVACIGLLLGSYIANMLDDKAYTDAKEKQADSCPNCARIRALKEASARRLGAELSAAGTPTQFGHKSQQELPRPHFNSDRLHASDRDIQRAVYTPRQRQQYHHHHQNRHLPPPHPGPQHKSWSNQSMEELPEESTPQPPPPPPPPPPGPPVNQFYGSSPQFSIPSSPQVGVLASPNILGSPMTRQILGRQSHTRHASFDIGKNIFGGGGDSGGSGPQPRKNNEGTPSRTPLPINEEVPETQMPAPNTFGGRREMFTGGSEASTTNMSVDDIGDDSDSDSASVSTVDQIVDERLYKIKAAKYVFLTLQEALGNSLVILAVGCVGFYLIENFTLVDSWYFTTVLLTTTGYGDIVPVTRGGKLFATIYLLVGGTILLNNMSLISMIPLELRKRRIERAVLTQFGDSLDDDALRELATGPLIRRLSLTAGRADGLAECTREMFALAMLVRLGKVSEDDIRQTFAAFRRLDLNGEGVLNSKSIIAGMIHRRRSVNPLTAARDMQQVQEEMEGAANRRPSMPQRDRSMRRFFFGRQGSIHIQTGREHLHFAASSPGENSALLHGAEAPTSYQTGPGSPGSQLGHQHSPAMSSHTQPGSPGSHTHQQQPSPLVPHQHPSPVMHHPHHHAQRSPMNRYDGQL